MVFDNPITNYILVQNSFTKIFNLRKGNIRSSQKM
jgi:hypothetical protein